MIQVSGKGLGKRRREELAPWKSILPISTFAPPRRRFFVKREERIEISQLQAFDQSFPFIGQRWAVEVAACAVVPVIGVPV